MSPAPHLYIGIGTYVVTLTAMNGNCSHTFTDTVTIIVGMNDPVSNSGIAIHPNPANGMTSVQFSLDQSTAVLQVINEMGQVVTERIVSAQGNVYKEDLDLNGLAAGMYTVHLKSATQSLYARLIKL